MSSTIPSSPHSFGASESTTSMSTRSPERRRDWEWEKVKVDVWHLLTEEKLPLGKVRDRLKAKGFDTTHEELKFRLRYWGFSGRTPIEVKKYITFKFRKRKQERKRSAIIVDGRLWTLAKVQKETSRNDYTSSELIQTPNPSTPPGLMVSVCSPPPSGLTVQVTHQWPPGLPWLRFLKLVSDAPVDIIGMMAQGLPGMRIASSGNDTLSRTVEPLCRWLPAGALDPIRLSNYLHTTMPEAFQGDHLLKSQGFCTQSGGASRELLLWALYRISNNVMDDDDTVCKTSIDNALLEMIDGSGLVGSKDPMLAEPTVMSVLEKVWAAALRQCRCRVVSWISDLDVSLFQSLLMGRGRHGPVRGVGRCEHPLVVTILNLEDSGCCEWYKKPCQRKKIPIHDINAVIGVLLTRGASPDEFCCGGHRTPLEWAIKHGYLDIVKTFVEHGVNTHGAGYLQTMDFNTLFYLAPENDLPRNRPGMMQYLQSLALIAFPPPGSPFGTLLTPEGLIRAAREGSLILLRLLHSAGADFNCSTTEGEFPLGAAIARKVDFRDRLASLGRTKERCKALVELGASVNYEPVATVDQEACPSALHIASVSGCEEVTAFLISEGANQHTPVRFYNGRRRLYPCVRKKSDSAARSPLGWALWRQSYSCAILLLDSGAPVEGNELLTLFETPYRGQPPAELVETLIARNVDLDLQTTSGKTALDLVVLNRYPRTASILRRAGASSKCITSSDIEALDTQAWLDHGKNILNSDTRPDRSLLEEWFRLFPSMSVDSENARLHALVEYLTDYDFGRGFLDKSLETLGFLFQCYPQAYSSSTLLGVTRVLTDEPENPKWLAIFYELLKRRRPEFVKSGVEQRALRSLIDLAVFTDHQRDNDALEFLPWQLLSQEPLLRRMPSHPTDDPLLGLFEFYDSKVVKRRLILEKLVEPGFKVTTALGLMAISRGCSVSELGRLMELGFDPRRRYRWSHTALQYAVSEGDHDMVRLLLNHHVSVNASPRWCRPPNDGGSFGNESGRTALQIAAERGDMECSRLLVDSGADVNAPPARVRGGTALQLASMKGYIGIVRWLISEGANVHARAAPVKGMTAMEGAAMQGKLDIVGLLLEHGNFGDGEGRHQLIRAVGWAKKENHQALSLYLQRQVGWTKEDEETLAHEELGGHQYGEWWRGAGYRHRGCAGDWESVGEDMEEPDCCWEEDSSNGSQSPLESFREDDERNPSREAFVLGAPEGRQQGEAPAIAYSAPFEDFWDTCVLPGIEADARIGERVSVTPGRVVGEIFEDGNRLDGQGGMKVDGQDGGKHQWMEEFVNF